MTGKTFAGRAGFLRQTRIGTLRIHTVTAAAVKVVGHLK